MEDIIREVELVLEQGRPENREELYDLLALASKVSQISNLQELADAFVDWLIMCEEDIIPVLSLINKCGSECDRKWSRAEWTMSGANSGSEQK